VFLISSGFAICGSLIAWFLLPDRSRELETEDARFRGELIARGYYPEAFGEGLKSNLKFSVYDIDSL
jgi:hypothetical protein